MISAFGKYSAGGNLNYPSKTTILNCLCLDSDLKSSFEHLKVEKAFSMFEGKSIYSTC